MATSLDKLIRRHLQNRYKDKERFRKKRAKLPIHKKIEDVVFLQKNIAGHPQARDIKIWNIHEETK